MNIKDMIIPLGLALATSFAIQYFVLNKYGPQATVDESAESFVAPKVMQAQTPLQTEVDFIDDARVSNPVLTTIKTAWGQATFSTHGAVLQGVVFERPTNGDTHKLTTLLDDTSREHGCFLVALDDKTPYNYELINRLDSDAETQLVYRAQAAGRVITKTFSVYNNTHKIDMNIAVAGKGVTPRVLYPSPQLDKELPSAVIIGRRNTFEKIAHGSLDEQRAWVAPALFGSADKYFIHALIADTNTFVQRAYYTKISEDRLLSVLEGPVVDSTQSWNLSFYFGPKEGAAIAAVDDRLEQAFEYSGMLAPLSKLLLAVLNWFYSYVHNYGFAIILLTILLRLLMMPFTIKSRKSMKKQSEHKKKLDYIQQKYKHDPEQLRVEREKFLRTHGMPGLGGCLPMLMQIPIFFALSRVLSSSIELYKAPMLWIPDLAQKDPYYILPVLVCLGMLLTQIGRAKNDTQQMMSNVALSLTFGAVSAYFSAGLALYVMVGSFMGVLENEVAGK